MAAREENPWTARWLRIAAFGLILSLGAVAGCAKKDDSGGGGGLGGTIGGSGGQSEESSSSTTDNYGGTVKGEGSPGLGWLGALSAFGAVATLVAWKRRTA